MVIVYDVVKEWENVHVNARTMMRARAKPVQVSLSLASRMVNKNEKCYINLFCSTMAIREIEDPNNFYRALVNADGSKIYITVPQFFTNTGMTAIKYAKHDRFTYVPIAYRMEINLTAIFPQLVACQNAMGGNTKLPFHFDSKRVFVTDDFLFCHFMYADGSNADKKDLYDKQCTILIELFVRGYRCTNGISKLDIVPRRCMFINTDGEARIRLEFPKPVEHLIQGVPPHMMTMFKMLPLDQRICSICTEEISSDLCQTKCFHHFHVACLRRTVNPACPNCRSPL